jgi:nicotinate-nucleotide adenylyltransferase
MRIGIFGGTFNPPHGGHRLVSLTAIRRLKLDAVWWVVTPGNPLKENAGLPSLDVRMRAAQQIANHPKIVISSFEAEIGTRYTYDTIAYLKAHCSGVHFVWLMGADNLASFHRWQNWKGIARLMPLAVIDRPHSTLRAVSSRAAHYLAKRRVPEHRAPSLPTCRTPAFIFLHGPRSDLSSTELRAKGRGL